MKLMMSMLCSLMMLMGSPLSFAESTQGNSATTTPPEQMEKPHHSQHDKQHSQDGSASGSGNDIQKLKKKSETESNANKSRDMQKENSGNSY